MKRELGEALRYFPRFKGAIGGTITAKKVRSAAKRGGIGRLGVGEFEYPLGFNVSRVEPGLDHDGPTKERLHKEALFLKAVFEVEPTTQASLEEIPSPMLLELKLSCQFCPIYV